MFGWQNGQDCTKRHCCDVPAAKQESGNEQVRTHGTSAKKRVAVSITIKGSGLWTCPDLGSNPRVSPTDSVGLSEHVANKTNTNLSFHPADFLKVGMCDAMVEPY